MADSLTDEQLVVELKSYGESVSLPIKANKRPILMKKLNHLRSRNKPPQQRGRGRQPQQRHELGAFSSDDSDTEPVPTPGPSFSRNSRGSPEPSASSKVTEVVTRSLRRRPNVSPMSVSVRGRQKHELDRKESPGRPASVPSLTRNQRRSRREETPEPDELSQNGSSYRSPRLYPDISALSDGAAQIDNSFSDRSTIPFESSDSDVEGSSYEVENKSVNTSIGLLRGRRTPTSNHVSPNRHSYSPRSSHETNHTPSKSSPVYRGRPKRRFYPEHVSFGLVALGLAFFVVIFLGYVSIRKELFMGWLFSDPSAHDNNNYLLCSEYGSKKGGTGSPDQQTNCYENTEVKKAVIVINDLFSDLSVRKGKVLCHNAPDSEGRMTTDSFLKDLREKKGLSDSLKLYNCCLDLIIANPGWNLRVLTKDGGEAKTLQEVSYLESAVPSMGFLCRLQRSFSRVMWSLFLLAAGIIILGIVLVLLWWRIQAKEKEEQKVFAMVEQIIDLLKQYAQNEDAEQSGLPVQHVRDQLLPPARRKALQQIWDKAVKFIEANESRVRLETKVIQGEEFDVWRWIQAVPNGGKVWQGQAFGEHNENNSTTAIYSPTPCLKIRNMFDKEV
ncbi:hypothetical protein V1264_020415 [Littorina saxatilis]|uniref:LEM domain-containing protein n=2 Tax=Littorina saxatilis TaxID=31220 RepID=A0AAN9GBI0_9CAEN